MSLRAPQTAAEGKFQYCNYGRNKDKYPTFEDCMKNYMTNVTNDFPPISGVVTCGDGTKALPPFTHCQDINGVNTSVKTNLPIIEDKKNEILTIPAPTLPNGVEAVVTNNDNTQKYILYAILALVAYSVLIKK
jgi:hypothetical protein